MNVFLIVQTVLINSNQFSMSASVGIIAKISNTRISTGCIVVENSLQSMYQGSGKREWGKRE